MQPSAGESRRWGCHGELGSVRVLLRLAAGDEMQVILQEVHKVAAAVPAHRAYVLEVPRLLLEPWEHAFDHRVQDVQRDAFAGLLRTRCASASYSGSVSGYEIARVIMARGGHPRW